MVIKITVKIRNIVKQNILKFALKISLSEMIQKLYFLNFRSLFYIPTVNIESCLEKGSNYVNVNFGKPISFYILTSLFSCV